MIELVSEARCIGCNKCVQACPMNVFDAVKNAPPIIARQEDCQTCFMCELYCPVDALYVAPDAMRVTPVSEESVAAAKLLGSYRATGWAIALGADRPMDQSFRLNSAAAAAAA
jgi:NAD-dependent dihydropyrimidine dehydrogenase PreA subunit